MQYPNILTITQSPTPKNNHHPELLTHKLNHSILGSEHSETINNLMSIDDPTKIEDSTEKQVERAREKTLIGLCKQQDYE